MNSLDIQLANAVEQSDLGKINLLLSQGANPLVEIENYNLLYTAAEKGKFEVVRLLLEEVKKLPEEQKEEELSFAFDAAICNGHNDVAVLLIHAGANGLIFSCPFCGELALEDWTDDPPCDHVIVALDDDDEPFIIPDFVTSHFEQKEECLQAAGYGMSDDLYESPGAKGFVEMACEKLDCLSHVEDDGLTFVLAEDREVALSQLKELIDDQWRERVEHEKSNSPTCPICGNHGWRDWEVSIAFVDCDHLVAGWDDSFALVCAVDKGTLKELAKTIESSRERVEDLDKAITGVYRDIILFFFENHRCCPTPESLLLAAIMNALFPAKEERFYDQPPLAILGWEAVGYYFGHPDDAIFKMEAIMTGLRAQLWRFREG
jgi:hypothetical protein